MGEQDIDVQITGNEILPLAGLAAVLGTPFLVLYSASPLLPFARGQTASGIPTPTIGAFVFPTVTLGALAATWGGFALRDRSPNVFTEPRALVAPSLAALAGALGLVAFAHEMVRVTSMSYGAAGASWTDASFLVANARRELSTGHVLSPVALSATLVGTVSRRRGRRLGLSTALAVAIIAVAFTAVVFGGNTQIAFLLVVTALVSTVPAAVGYYAARSL